MAVTFELIDDTPLMSKFITRVSGLKDTWNKDAVNFEFSIHDINERDSIILSACVMKASIVHNSSDEVARDSDERSMIMFRTRVAVAILLL